MNDFFKKFKDILVGKSTETDTGESEGCQKPITRQELVNQVLEHYKMRFDEESTNKIMAFPTSFCVFNFVFVFVFF